MKPKLSTRLLQFIMGNYFVDETMKEVVQPMIPLAMKIFALQNMMPRLKEHVGINVLMNVSTLAIDV